MIINTDTPGENPYVISHQTIPDHAVFITPPPSIKDKVPAVPKRQVISRPPPQHAGVNIPGGSYPPDSGNIQDIISHHIHQSAETTGHNGRPNANNERYHHDNNKYNGQPFPNQQGNQNYRPPIKDLTKPPPIIIAKTTGRPQTFSDSYRNRPTKLTNSNVIPPVSPDSYHDQGDYDIPGYPHSTNGGIDRYDTNIGHTNRDVPYNVRSTNKNEPSLFDTHNRLQPIIIDDGNVYNKGDRNTRGNKNTYNRRADINQPNYVDSTHFTEANAIDPNDYKFYSFITKNPTPTSVRHQRPTTTRRPQPYSPTRSNPKPTNVPGPYTTRKIYAYKPHISVVPSSTPNSIR